MEKEYKNLIFNLNEKVNKMLIEMLVIQETINTNNLSKEELYFLKSIKNEMMKIFKKEFRRINNKEIKKYNCIKECKIV